MTRSRQEPADSLDGNRLDRSGEGDEVVRQHHGGDEAGLRQHQQDDGGEGPSTRGSPLNGTIRPPPPDANEEVRRMYELLLDQQERMAVAIRDLQRHSPMYSAPGSDSTEAIERMAEALAKIKPQVAVPGDPGPYEGGQDFHRWRKYVLRFQATNRWTPRELQDRMGQFLEGPAWATFERLRDGRALPLDPGAMLDAIGAAHCDIRGAERAAEARFIRRKQRNGESIYDFLAHFEALAADCRAEENFKIRTFISNVQPEARDQLTRRDARTWQELKAAAMLEQQVLDNRGGTAGREKVGAARVGWQDEGPDDEEEPQARVAAVQGGRPWYQADARYAGYNGTRGPGAPGPAYHPARGPGAPGPAHLQAQGEFQPGAPGLQRSTLEEKLDRLAALVLEIAHRPPARRGPQCHRCGEQGHFVRECPVPPGNGAGAEAAAALPRAQQ
jgi:hypothetical protein